jgi:hypothetical protein
MRYLQRNSVSNNLLPELTDMQAWFDTDVAVVKFDKMLLIVSDDLYMFATLLALLN